MNISPLASVRFLPLVALLFLGTVLVTPAAYAQGTAIKMLPPTNCPNVTQAQITAGASNVWGVLGWDSKSPLSCVPNFQFGDNGYTGIGSAAAQPQALLDLYGSATYSYPAPGTGAIGTGLGNIHMQPVDNLDFNSTAITFGADMTATPSNGTYDGTAMAGIYVQYSVRTAYPAPGSGVGTRMLFGTSNSGAGSQIRMTIDNNGNVGIGTTTPAYALDVNGATRATAFYHVSDARMKTDIRPITHALDKMLALKGVAFNWKKDGRPDMGITAQNVATVFPDVVSKSPDGMMAVEYDSMIGPMIEALRELKAENDRLEIKVDALEKSLKAQKE